MPVTRRWTVEDVRALADASRDGTRYELVDGALLVTPAPRWVHQAVVLELGAVLREYLNRAEVGTVVIAPADLRLSADSITQPDLFVVPSPPLAALTDMRVLLVIEVLSPSTERTDRGIKREFYLSHGVAEYWIVDADARTIERFRPDGGQGTVHRDEIVWGPGTAPSLRIDLPALFDRVDAAAQATAWLERPRPDDDTPRA